MSVQRIIKKYPNRRLYDTAISCYIRLDDVRDLILEYVPIKVIDARTGEDLTNTTLLQIITEQEDSGSPIFTTEILQTVIRFYGHSLQHMMSGFLEESVKCFAQQQEKIEASLPPFTSSLMGMPLEWMSDLAKDHLALWQNMQQKFFGLSASQKPKTD